MSAHVRRLRHGLGILLLAVAADAHAGQLAMNPSLVDFGSVQVAGGPVVRTMKIINHGSPTTISGFKSNNGCSEFTANATGLPRTLADVETLTVQVTYDPSNRGPDICGFKVLDDNSVTDVLGLSGSGLAPGLRIFDPNLAFTTQPFDAGVPETLIVSVENQGNESITAPHFSVQIASGAHFSFEPVALPIAPNGASDLRVAFHPTSPGPKSDQLTVSIDNGLTGDSNVIVNLSGTWTDPTAVGEGVLGESPLRIEPSPTLGTLRISCAVARPGTIRFEVRDIAGRIVARSEAYATAEIHTATLRRGADWSPAPGVYAVRATLDGHTIGRGRVVVLR